MMTELGKVIKKALVDKGLTQKELAERIGMDRKYLNKIVRGVRRPGTYSSVLAQELGISEDDIRRLAG